MDHQSIDLGNLPFTSRVMFCSCSISIEESSSTCSTVSIVFSLASNGSKYCFGGPLFGVTFEKIHSVEDL
jgi:hypothetical protein